MAKTLSSVIGLKLWETRNCTKINLIGRWNQAARCLSSSLYLHRKWRLCCSWAPWPARIRLILNGSKFKTATGLLLISFEKIPSLLCVLCAGRALAGVVLLAGPLFLLCWKTRILACDAQGSRSARVRLTGWKMAPASVTSSSFVFRRFTNRKTSRRITYPNLDE